MAAIAFSLALFSHILNHVVIRLQSALNELENPRRVLTVEDDDLEGMCYCWVQKTLSVSHFYYLLIYHAS